MKPRIVAVTLRFAEPAPPPASSPPRVPQTHENRTARLAVMLAASLFGKSIL